MESRRLGGAEPTSHGREPRSWYLESSGGYAFHSVRGVRSEEVARLRIRVSCPAYPCFRPYVFKLSKGFFNRVSFFRALCSIAGQVSRPELTPAKRLRTRADIGKSVLGDRTHRLRLRQY